MASPPNPQKTSYIGGELAKIGRVFDMASLPCQPTPEIWVLAFWYGIPRMLWSLFKPDTLDETWSRVGVRRGFKRRGRFKFFDQYQEAQPIKLPPGLRWVRFAGDWAQRVGWWLLIVDAAIDHAMYWQSAAMSFDGCATDNNPFALGDGDNLAVSHFPFWQDIPVAVTQTFIFGGGVGQVSVPPGFGYYAGFSLSSIGNPNTPGFQSTVAAWRIVENGEVIASGETVPGLDGNSSGGAGFIRKPILGLSGKLLAFQTRLNQSGSCIIKEANITVTGAGLPTGLKQGDP
jgi:hypothetical protein